MTNSLVRQWILTPIIHYRLFHNFTKQDFLGQFAASIGGLLWLFLTPIVQILTYAFVFSFVFRMESPEDFSETSFVLFMVIGYLPWFAFADTVARSPNLLIEKAPLITKVMFPTQIIPVVGTVVPYLTHGIGFGVLLLYMIFQGHLNWLWLWMPLVFFLQFLFTMGLVAIISALCVFLRDLQQLVGILVFIWFFLTPIVYPISMIQDESIQNLFLLNPMHSFVNIYREVVLLGEMPFTNLYIIIPVSLLTYLFGGWFYMRIKHAFGDVL